MDNRELGRAFMERIGSINYHSAGLRAVAEKAWEEGFVACAEWWEIHHYQAVIAEKNPYREPEEPTDG